MYVYWGRQRKSKTATVWGEGGKELPFIHRRGDYMVYGMVTKAKQPEHRILTLTGRVNDEWAAVTCSD